MGSKIIRSGYLSSQGINANPINATTKHTYIPTQYSLDYNYEWSNKNSPATTNNNLRRNHKEARLRHTTKKELQYILLFIRLQKKRLRNHQ